MITLFTTAEAINLKQVESTNSYLKELAKQKEIKEGTWVQAEYQTLGRGQIGNTWEAAAGQNLLASYYLKPKYLKANQGFWLNMSVCLALYDTLKNFYIPAQIKWPNDILVGQSKVAGLLIENTIVGKNIDTAIVGIGLNINQRKFKSSKATSMVCVLNKNLALADVVSVLQSALSLRYAQLKNTGQASIKQAYVKHLYGWHKAVMLQDAGGFFAGSLSNVDSNGMLTVTKSSGAKQRYAFKELRFLL